MDVGAALVADGQSAVRSEPRQCPLYNPPLAAQPDSGIPAPPCNADLNPTAVEGLSAEGEVVSLVSMQLLWSVPGPAPTPLDHRDRVQQLLKELAVVDVSASDRHREG